MALEMALPVVATAMLGYTVLGLEQRRRALGLRRATQPLARYPSLSIVRPIRGLDPGARDNLAAALDNVVVLVEGRHPTEPDLLGLYEGIALTERDSFYAGALPDTITIYRDALLDMCDSEEQVVDEVAITVIHEIAHHFGIDDDRLHELGWG